MTKVCLLLAATIMFVGTVCMAQYVVEPGHVVQEPNSQLISGSIVFKKTPFGKPGMTGGGCLIYTPVADPTPCTSNQQCTAARAGDYCAPYNNGTAQPDAMVCWRQPEQPSCHKSPMTPLEDGKTYPFDQLTNPYPVGVSRPIKWRVVSCQNLVPGGCAGTSPVVGTAPGAALRYGDIKIFE